MGVSLYSRWRGRASTECYAPETASDIVVEETKPAVARGTITLGGENEDLTASREPIARIVIDLYGLERLVTVHYLIPEGSEVAPLFRPGPTEAEGWKVLVSTLTRNLDEIAEIHARKWWTPEQARFKVGARVRVVGDPNWEGDAFGTIASSPGPRLVGPGVVYRVTFDELQVNRHDKQPRPAADVLEDYLRPLDG